MSLEDIVEVQISANSKTPTRPGFGTALLLCQKLPAGWGVNPVREFASLTELTDAGFSTSDPAYKMATKLKSQNPAPKKFKIGKRANLATRLIKLTVTVATEGFVYSLTIDGKAITYAVPAAATTTSVATAIAALVTGTANNVTATAAAAVITCTAAAGVCYDVDGWYVSKMLFEDASTNPAGGIEGDLATCNGFDSDWYGLLVDQAGKAEIVAAAAWTEANKKLYVYDTCDSGCMDSGSTTDVMATLKVSAYARTGGFMCTANALNYAACGMLGSRFPRNPGSDTWKFKTLAGVSASKMTEGQKSAVFAKKGNTYTTVAGINMTEEGWSSAGEFLDVVRFIDWLESEIKVRVFFQLVNAEKVPYTDTGVDLIKSIIQNTLNDGIKVGGLAADPAPVVDAPLVADIDPSIRATRHLPDVTFSGRLAGAIHSLTIVGTLSV